MKGVYINRYGSSYSTDLTPYTRVERIKEKYLCSECTRNCFLTIYNMIEKGESNLFVSTGKQLPTGCLFNVKKARWVQYE